MADNNGVFSKGSSTPNEPDLSSVTLETLVGEGRKYKEADELAKAYAHSDAFIASLKEEKVAREAKLKVLEEMLEARKNGDPADPNKANVNGSEDDGGNNPHQSQSSDNRSSEESTKDFSERFKEEFERINEEKTFGSNVNEVSNRLVEQFGSDREANNFVKAKAKELNVSVDWLMDIAGRSPQAFNRTVGLEGNRSTPAPNSGADKNVNTASFRNKDGGRNFKYYEDVRKNDPKLYYSQGFQKQLINDAREQGSGFYN